MPAAYIPLVLALVPICDAAWAYPTAGVFSSIFFDAIDPQPSI